MPLDIITEDPHLHLTDGRTICRDHAVEADVIIVGSGPAGAAAARTLSRRGAEVILVEEGPRLRLADFVPDGFGAMAQAYRGLGATISTGRSPVPLVQGRAVGGTSVINGAISWRLPRDVLEEWHDADPALRETLDGEKLEALFDEIERDLCIAPTPRDIAGANNLLMAKGAEALGLEHRPIRRNVSGCEGLGRCLQGCPRGHKKSMDRTYLVQACARGARIFSSCRAERVCIRGGRARGVVARAEGGGTIRLQARQAVVLAASAIQSPALLLRSGVRRGPVGENFRCHPGLSVLGRFDEDVEVWTGATQGHEVIGLRREGLKFEALGYDRSLAAMRMPGTGRALHESLKQLGRCAHWGVAVRARAAGRVRLRRGLASVSFSLQKDDARLFQKGVRTLSEMLFAAGAQAVHPGVHGLPTTLHGPDELGELENVAARDPRAYSAAVTHMFGTCRMGSDPARSVVRPDFRVHATDALYVADSSVFPSHTGVNPQTSIIALATLCGESVSLHS